MPAGEPNPHAVERGMNVVRAADKHVRDLLTNPHVVFTGDETPIPLPPLGSTERIAAINEVRERWAKGESLLAISSDKGWHASGARHLLQTEARALESIQDTEARALDKTREEDYVQDTEADGLDGCVARIRHLRRRKKMTSAMLAAKTDVSRSVIANIEARRTAPSAANFAAIASALDVTMEKLWYGTDPVIDCDHGDELAALRNELAALRNELAVIGQENIYLRSVLADIAWLSDAAKMRYGNS